MLNKRFFTLFVTVIATSTVISTHAMKGKNGQQKTTPKTMHNLSGRGFNDKTKATTITNSLQGIRATDSIDLSNNNLVLTTVHPVMRFLSINKFQGTVDLRGNPQLTSKDLAKLQVAAPQVTIYIDQDSPKSSGSGSFKKKK